MQLTYTELDGTKEEAKAKILCTFYSTPPISEASEICWEGSDCLALC